MKLCRAKSLVNSPEMLSYMARNFIKFNNILASVLHIYRACFVSLKVKERVILHIYRACFVVHRGFRAVRDILLTHSGSLYTACFASLSLKERVCYTFIPLVSSHGRVKNEIYYTLCLFLCALHLIKFGRHASALRAT